MNTCLLKDVYVCARERERERMGYVQVMCVREMLGWLRQSVRIKIDV